MLLNLVVSVVDLAVGVELLEEPEVAAGWLAWLKGGMTVEEGLMGACEEEAILTETSWC